MVGDSQKNDKTFDPEHYEEFYTNHHFQPLSDEDALNCHEVIPRFGWGFDKIEAIYAAKKKTLRVLDLGCLDGSFLLTLAKHQPWVTGVGVDLTQDGIAIAQERAWAENLPVTFEQGTIEGRLQNFIDEGRVFDVVTWFEVIEHVKDVQLCLDLIDQVITHDGTVLCSTPAFESPTFGMNDEQNKCHIRLFTMKDHDYTAVNKYGHRRKATSFPQLLGSRITEMGVYSELINLMYK